MGVDYTAVLMVGKEFESPDEAAAFLREHGIDIPDEESEEMEDGLREYLYSFDVHGLEYEKYDYYGYSDYGVLGWSPNVRDYKSFPAQVQSMLEQWQTLFKEDAGIHHFVSVS